MTQNPWRNIAKLPRRRVLVVITARTRRGGGYVLLLGVASSCVVAPENHIDVLRTWCEEQTKCNSPLHLDRGVGVCFGKAAIIRPRAPPRDDKLQSIECDTRHSTKFLSNDASGDGRRVAANRMKIDTAFTHTQAGFLTSACTKGV